jgi:heme-degrading monooxygenase HmoA
MRTPVDNSYGETADRMVELAAEQPGFLGVESAREGLGITVSYWESLEAIRHWKMNTEHLLAQRMGREQWYSAFKLRVCRVERDYDMGL